MRVFARDRKVRQILDYYRIDAQLELINPEIDDAGLPQLIQTVCGQDTRIIFLPMLTPIHQENWAKMDLLSQNQRPTCFVYGHQQVLTDEM